jgi:ribosomal protein L37AE/L43A
MLCDPEKGIDDYGQVNCGACEQGVDVTLAVRTPKGVWLCGHCDAEVKKLEEGKI